MFDITSFIREKIFRRPKINSSLAWEELSEKQTTKLWYFLLYCMFWAILTSAQWTLSIIRDIPDRPTYPPYCVSTMINTFGVQTDSYYDSYSYSYNSNDCGLTANNPKFDFTQDYNKLLAPYKEIQAYQESIQKLEYDKQKKEFDEKDTQKDYNTSLTEKIADEKSWLYNTQNIQNNIKENRSSITNIETQISDLQAKITAIKTQYKTEVNTLNENYKKTLDDYKTAYLLYKLYVAILSLIFSIIVFVILYNIYVKQKIKNSPNTIIFSVATFAYWLVLLQISGMFIWDIIPHKHLTLIINFLSLFTPLIYLVQFLWPLVIIAVFGFLVYKIQKRLYSPANVLKRFISDKKCPHCWNGVDFTKPFCPLCANEIQIDCQSCHKLTLKWMPYCSNCGEKL